MYFLYFLINGFFGLALADSRVNFLPESCNPLNFTSIKDNRIVGGHVVEKHSRPFQASLQKNGQHFCGASIVSEKFVLTAAHCCVNKEQETQKLQVVVGDHDRNVDEGNEQYLRVSRIIMHEDYNRRTISNDICLIMLIDPIRMTKAISPVSLPSNQQTFRGNAVVSGWGSLNSGDARLPSKLREVTVPIVKDRTCKKSYGIDAITPTMFCAGAEGIDSCQGDSGGPLTCGKYLCGIVSWGYGCAEKDYPGVYTKVSHFVSWINFKMYLYN